MRAKKSFRKSSGPVVARLALMAATSLVLYPLQGRAGDDSDETATRAFLAGLGDPSGELTLTRHGRNFLLEGALPEAPEVTASLECHLCNEAEVASTARAVGALLAEEVRGEEASRLRVSTAAVGVRVLVDGLPGIAGPAGQVIEPGDHTVASVQNGAEREINLAPGEEGSVSLRSSAGGDGPGLRMPLLVTGIGLSVAAAAIPLLVLDGRCASDRVDAEGDCEELHDTAPLGWGMLGAGAALAVTGIVVALVSRRLREKRSASGKEVVR